MIALAFLATAAAASAPEMAITFDDLPAHSLLPPGTTRVAIADKVIAALKAAGVPPTYGFVNGVQLEREPASAPVLDAWRAAGFPLGNHTWSHPNLNALTVPAFEAEIARNEPLLASKMAGADWHWLRYPFLAEGDDPAKRLAIRGWLANHSYKIAAVTMSFGDYAFNEPYARCVTKGDEAAIAQLKASYLQAARDTITATRTLAQQRYGRDIPYVLLMHIGALDAELLPQLLAIYKQAGFRFVSLRQAERDPVFRADVDPSLPPEGHPLPPGPSELAGLDAVCR